MIRWGRRALLLAAAALFYTGMAAQAASAADLDCSDFASQADAQDHLRANPSDPDGLDRDVDGVACEWNPAPKDLTPVDHDGKAPSTVGPSNPATGDALPRTGPWQTYGPVSMALLLTGALLIATTRYRGRHSRR